MTGGAEETMNGLKGLKSVLLGLIFLVTLIAILGMLTQSSDKNTITNYEQCARTKDSRIVESYPSVCTTKDKRSFVNTSQQRQCGRAGFATNPNLCR